MLTMEIAKPMLLTRVSRLPTASRGAFIAVSVENCGESPTTVVPQVASQSAKRRSPASSISGASRQQAPLAASCAPATLALPKRRTSSPPATHADEAEADHRERGG